METTKCKGCGKKVIFAKDENGKRQILDAVAPCYALRLVGKNLCFRSEGTYVSHFATCSAANQFSKNKKGSAAQTAEPSERE